MRLPLPPMLKFLIRRLLSAFITFFVITATIYGMILLTPAETRARLYMGRKVRVGIDPEIERRAVEATIRRFGMNDPYPVQYFRWVSHLLRGDWGWSPRLRSEVLDALLVRAPATAELTLYSLLLFIPLGLASGAIAGWKRDRITDHGFRLVSYKH